MRRYVKPVAALGLAAAMALTATTPSTARHWHNGWAAAGAGFLAGTFIGAAAANANARYYYGEPYAYYGEPYAYDSYGYAPGYYDSYAYAPAYRVHRYYGPVYNNTHEQQLTSPNY